MHVRESLCIAFTAIQTRCSNLSLADLDKADNVTGWPLRGIDALQESREIRTRVVALKASGAGQSTKIGALESHERELLDDNRGLENQLVAAGVREKRCEAPDAETTKAVPEPEIELVHAKEALHVFEGRRSVDKSALCSAIEAWLPTK